MVFRLAIGFLIALAVFAGLRMLLAKKRITVRQFGLIYAAALVGLVLLFLGVTGRLHWLFTVLGIALPFMLRIIPFVLQLMNLKQAVSWFQRMTSGSTPSSGQTSELNTRFFAMMLDHDSGHMDGRVLEGQFQGRLLSDLGLDALLSLLQEVTVDADSENVLRAYLDRAHPDWQAEASAGSGPEIREGNLSVDDACDILGSEPGADKKAIREAHRRLIRQNHPDHGGSNYLAARINEAKDVLLRHLGD
ncbi:MAG: molecular chaperone DnaJ [Gammaproteobacteria bacterium]|nr:molecular chaperone DnaJ [Gammaproteobacteria bacterium]